MDCALVFGGGGGKGAYEVGVWRALHEMGYAGRFAAVFGTSVGALNGAFFVRKKLAEAEKVWLEELDQAKIFGWEAAVKRLFAGNASGRFPLEWNAAAFPRKTSKLSQNGGAGSCPPTFNIWEALQNGGLFQFDGLREILETYLPDPVPDAPDFYVCTAKMSGGAPGQTSMQTFFETEYTAECVKINGMSHEEEVSFLLASSALPVFFPPVVPSGAKNGSEKRRDGGVIAENNVPYLRAVRMGYEKILAVSLGNDRIVSRRYSIAEERRGTPYARAPLPAGNSGFSDVLVLCPTVSLGDFWKGTLDFSKEGAAWREELGYTNCTGLYRETIERFFSRMEKTRA